MHFNTTHSTLLTLNTNNKYKWEKCSSVLIKNVLCSRLQFGFGFGNGLGKIIKVFQNVLIFLGLGNLVEQPGKEWDGTLEVQRDELHFGSKKGNYQIQARKLH